MASESVVADLLEQKNSFENQVDSEKLLRPFFGDRSLGKEITPVLEQAREMLGQAISFTDSTYDEAIQDFTTAFSSLITVLTTIQNDSDGGYVDNRDSYISQLDIAIQQLTRCSQPFVIAKLISDKGFSEDKSIRKEAEDKLAEFQEETDKILESVKEEAARIEQGARRTAAGISMKDAQAQFKDMQFGLNRASIISGMAGATCLFILFGVAASFMNNKISDEWRWSLIYYTAIRISILTALGTLTAFSLKIFRSFLHLRQKNLHRIRVANSTESFVEAASTPEQRDQILIQLVESITQFGSSGLVSGEDAKTKLPIDSISIKGIPSKVSSGEKE